MEKYKLIVSEPWDFESQQGDNQLTGHIIRQIDLENLLFEAEDQTTFSGVTSQYWVFSTRYEKQHFEAEPYEGTVTGGLLADLPSESDDASEIKKHAVFAVIGSLQPFDPRYKAPAL